MDLIGKQFNVYVADGRSTYRVTDDDGVHVTVEFVPDGSGFDDYKDNILGDRCEVSRENIESVIAQQERINSIFGRRV